jgi:hypothetical protein
MANQTELDALFAASRPDAAAILARLAHGRPRSRTSQPHMALLAHGARPPPGGRPIETRKDGRVADLLAAHGRARPRQVLDGGPAPPLGAGTTARRLPPTLTKTTPPWTMTSLSTASCRAPPPRLACWTRASTSPLVSRPRPSSLCARDVRPRRLRSRYSWPQVARTHEPLLRVVPRGASACDSRSPDYRPRRPLRRTRLVLFTRRSRGDTGGNN